MDGHFLPKETQGSKNAITGIGQGNIAALVANAESGKAKPGGGNAGDASIVRPANGAPILHQPVVRIGLFPEELKISFFEILQKFIILLDKPPRPEVAAALGSLAEGGGGSSARAPTPEIAGMEAPASRARRNSVLRDKVFHAVPLALTQLI